MARKPKNWKSQYCEHCNASLLQAGFIKAVMHEDGCPDQPEHLRPKSKKKKKNGR